MTLVGLAIICFKECVIILNKFFICPSEVRYIFIKSICGCFMFIVKENDDSLLERTQIFFEFLKKIKLNRLVSWVKRPI